MKLYTRRRAGFSGFVGLTLGACTRCTPPEPAAAPEPDAAPTAANAAPSSPATAPSSSSSPATEARFEDGVNRPGGDLRTFKLPEGGAEACAAACEKEPKCYAYNYTKAEQAHHGEAECALKHNIPMASKSPCCVSGVIRPWP
jgi:PAN domain-containing protein